MSWWPLENDRQKRKVVDISTLYNIIRKCELCYYNIQLMPRHEEYIFYLYDDELKYICECQGIRSYDVRMLRKIFSNLYYYRKEVDEIAKIFGVLK